MLIPQFTIRNLMMLTAAAAVVSLVLAMAIRGEAWAVGVSAGVVTLAATFFVFACIFLGVWVVGTVYSAIFPAKPRDEAGGGL